MYFTQKPRPNFALSFSPCSSSSCGSHGASCGKWSLFRSVYTAGWKTRPPDCKYKHGTGFFFSPLFFSLLTLTVITVGQSKSSRKDPSCPNPDTFFPLLHSAPVCSPLKLCFGLMRVWRSSLHGLFLWRSNLETPNAKVIYLAVHPLLGFVRRERKGSGPYCIS